MLFTFTITMIQKKYYKNQKLSLFLKELLKAKDRNYGTNCLNMEVPFFIGNIRIIMIIGIIGGLGGLKSHYMFYQT